MQHEFLTEIVRRLDDADIPYMLAGSMASAYHSEPRMTRDIDIVIDPTIEAMERFVGALDRSRYYVHDAIDAVRRRDMCNVIDTVSGWKADLIMRRDRPFSQEEFGRRERAEIAGAEVDVATAEDTVLAKLEWRARSGSEQQMRDVVALLRAQTLDLDYLRRWAAELGVSESLDEALAAADDAGRDSP